MPSDLRLTKVTAEVASLVATTLSLAQPPRADQSFLELGMHSLLAVSLTDRLNHLYDLELPPDLLYEHPTSRELAERVLEELGASKSTALEATRPHSQALLLSLLAVIFLFLPLPAYLQGLTWSGPRQLSRSFERAKGTREVWLRTLAELRFSLFGSLQGRSKTPLLGSHNWWFLPSYGWETLDTAFVPLSPSEAENWCSTLRTNQRLLAAAGVRYLFVVAPNKTEIYPELLPNWYRPAPNKLDQVLAALRAYPEVEVLDLRPSLRASKSWAHLYPPSDQHWNEWGGWVAAQAIVETCRKWFPTPALLVRPRWKIATIPGGEIPHLVGLTRAPLEQLQLLWPDAIDHLDGYSTNTLKVATLGSGGRGPKAMLFADSFGRPLQQPLSRCFRQLVLVNRHAPVAEVVEAEQPEVVIQLIYQDQFELLPPRALTRQPVYQTRAPLPSAESLFQLADGVSRFDLRGLGSRLELTNSAPLGELAILTVELEGPGRITLNLGEPEKRWPSNPRSCPFTRQLGRGLQRVYFRIDDVRSMPKFELQLDGCRALSAEVRSLAREKVPAPIVRLRLPDDPPVKQRLRRVPRD